MSALTLLLLFALAGLGFSLHKRIAIWRNGCEADQELPMSLLMTVPKRYFVDLHHIVMRDEAMARTHVFVAGGVVAILGLLVIDQILFNIPAVIFAIIAAVIIVGAWRLRQRRAQNAPKKLSMGAFKHIPASLVLFSVGLTGLAVLDGGWLYALAALIGFVGAFDIFWAGTMDRPLKHMLSGAAHLAFHPRQERFKGERSVALKTADITKPQIGVAKPQEFAWNRLLSFDACIECGRCQEMCPAFASGQPLNPKKLIQDLLVGAQGGSDSRYTGAPYPNREVGKHGGQPNDDIVPRLIDPETLYACTTCRSCVEACPMMIEHVDAIVDLRRDLVTQRGELPENAVTALDNLRHSDSVQGYASHERQVWASDLDIPFASTDKKVCVLLLSGESGFDLRSQNTLRSLVKLLKRAGVNMALMEDETDTGDTARRLGDEVLFQQSAKRLIGKLNELKFDAIVTTDPHIYNTIKNEYPDLGGHFKIYHHSEYLLQLVEAGKLKTTALDETLTYHDPCYLGRYNGVVDAPRQLLSHIGVKVEEMTRSGTTSRCCGWGGGAAFTDIAGEQRIPDMRMDEIRETGCDKVAVACPNCTAMLEGVVEPRAEVVDIVELVNRSVEAA